MFKPVKFLSFSFIAIVATEVASAQGDFWEPVGGPKLGHMTVISIKSLDTIFAGSYSGLLRSTDGGESWQSSAISNPVSDLLVGSHGEVFAATYNCVYRSLDNGASWTTLTNGLPSGEVNFALHPNGDVFAGVYSGVTGGLYRSSDSGDHWTQVYLSGRDITPIVITDHGFILTGGAGILRSTDNGATWTRQFPEWITIYCFATSSRGDIFAGTGDRGILRSTDAGLSWDTANTGLTMPSSGYLSVTDLAAMDGDTLFATTWDDGLFRSTDNGLTWSETSLKHLPHEYPTCGPMAVYPGGLVFTGTRYLYRSSDGGNTWSRLNAGWNNVYVNSLAIDKGDTIYAGGNGLFRSSDHGTNWTELNVSEFGDWVSWLAVNSRGHIFAHIGPSGGGGWWNTSHLCRSMDHGETWISIADGSPIWPLAFDDSGHILIGNYQFLCSSRNDGQTWDTLWWGDYHTVNAVAIDPTGDWFAAISGAGIFRSTDYGASWDSVNNGLPYRDVSGLNISPAGDLYARVSFNEGGFSKTYLFRSTDRGAIWTLWDSLPWDVSTMLWTKSGDLYMSSNSTEGVRGVYKNGVWINSGLTNLSVASLSLDSRGYLYAGTFGNSVFRTVQPLTRIKETSAAMLPLHFVLEQNYPNPFNPKTVIRSQTPEAGNVRIVIYDVLGQEVKVLVNERRAAGTYEDVFDGNGLASGMYIYRLTAGTSIQSRRMMLLK